MFTVPKKLLSTNNYKTMKGEGLGYKTYILYMSSFTDNLKGINLCPMASAGCAAACLVNSGFGGIYKAVADARRNKSEYFLNDRVNFMLQIDREVAALVKREAGKAIPTIRLNGTTDIAWEKFKIRDNKNIFELYPNVQFYDYTKNYKRFDKVLAANYHLTFSRSETNNSHAELLLSKGYNVAVVFDKTPATYLGFEVVNGDKNDLRFLDGKNVIVGLKYKKMTNKGADNKAVFANGFAIDTSKMLEAA